MRKILRLNSIQKLTLEEMDLFYEDFGFEFEYKYGVVWLIWRRDND